MLLSPRLATFCILKLVFIAGKAAVEPGVFASCTSYRTPVLSSAPCYSKLPMLLLPKLLIFVRAKKDLIAGRPTARFAKAGLLTS